VRCCFSLSLRWPRTDSLPYCNQTHTSAASWQPMAASLSVASKSAVLRVASVACRDAQIAAICASAVAIGRQALSQLYPRRVRAGSVVGTPIGASGHGRAVSVQKCTMASAGVTIGYRDSGGWRPPVVLLHGLAGSGREFVATAEALPEFRVILVDLRGHGESTRRPRDLGRAAYVADVVGVIESVVGGPVALVGQSMGGHTAMLVAAVRPDLVGRLVLLE